MPDIHDIAARHAGCADACPCPICAGLNCEGCQAFCAHWVGRTQFNAWTALAERLPDFTEAVAQLVGLIDEWGTPLVARLIVRDEAPTPLRQVIWAAMEDPEYWLAHYQDLRLTFWARPAGEGCRCFHPQPRAFAQRVRDEAEGAWLWLVAHLPVLAEADLHWTDDGDSEDDEAY